MIISLVIPREEALALTLAVPEQSKQLHLQSWAGIGNSEALIPTGLTGLLIAVGPPEGVYTGGDTATGVSILLLVSPKELIKEASLILEVCE